MHKQGTQIPTIVNGELVCRVMKARWWLTSTLDMGCVKRSVANRSREVTSPSTLLWCIPTWSTASSSGVLRRRQTWTCQSGSRGGPWKRSEAWNTSPMKKGWERWSCLAWRKEGAGETVVGLHYVKGAVRKMEKDQDLYWQDKRQYF